MTYPMSYTNVDEVYTMFPELGSLSSVSSAHVFLVGGLVEAGINARLAPLYPLPFTANIPILGSIALNLTIYNVLAKRVMTDDTKGDEPWVRVFKESSLMLDKIVNGEIGLVDSSFNVITKNATLGTIHTNYDTYLPTMHEGNIEESFQDTTKLDDIDNERWP